MSGDDEKPGGMWGRFRIPAPQDTHDDMPGHSDFERTKPKPARKGGPQGIIEGGKGRKGGGHSRGGANDN